MTKIPNLQSCEDCINAISDINMFGVFEDMLETAYKKIEATAKGEAGDFSGAPETTPLPVAELRAGITFDSLPLSDKRKKEIVDTALRALCKSRVLRRVDEDKYAFVSSRFLWSVIGAYSTAFLTGQHRYSLYAAIVDNLHRLRMDNPQATDSVDLSGHDFGAWSFDNPKRYLYTDLLSLIGPIRE